MILSPIVGELDFMKAFVSSDQTVTGVLAIHESAVAIHEWNSLETGQGNTLKALEELREAYDLIAAVGIGASVDDPSWLYWSEMHSRGLVDKLEDDDGRDVTPRSPGLRP